jgi:hypothetical protein
MNAAAFYTKQGIELRSNQAINSGRRSLSQLGPDRLRSSDAAPAAGDQLESLSILPYLYSMSYLLMPSSSQSIPQNSGPPHQHPGTICIQSCLILAAQLCGRCNESQSVSLQNQDYLGQRNESVPFAQPGVGVIIVQCNHLTILPPAIFT